MTDDTELIPIDELDEDIRGRADAEAVHSGWNGRRLVPRYVADMLVRQAEQEGRQLEELLDGHRITASVSSRKVLAHESGEN